MQSFKKSVNIAGLVVLAITFIVYAMTAERTGSLWDCGEFILGAYKLQVVHPPGAGLFVLIGRIFAFFGEIFGSAQSDISFAVNLMSSLASAAAAMLIGWTTMIMGKVALVGREKEPTSTENVALMFAGVAAGLATAFCTSIWFSAVEGEVYGMSTFFTALVIWGAAKWYHLPDENDSDRWLVFTLFAAGLSIGVHLLSLLALPYVGLLYYIKKHGKLDLKGFVLSILAGLAMVVFIQKIVIVGIPTLWKNFELFTVNSLGLPIHSGLIPAVIAIIGLAYAVIRYTHRKQYRLLHLLAVAATLITIAYTTIGVVVIRSNADTPVNMNMPTDVMRLIPYLNREQYGERPLLKGPHYAAQPVGIDRSKRWTRVGDEYKQIDEKFEYKYNPRDEILFPRIGHSDRAELHKVWRSYLGDESKGKPGMSYNLKFFITYQLKHMYWRYFMWNFSGRQNAFQGVYDWNSADGNWMSGIGFIDNMMLHDMSNEPDLVKMEESRNVYYMLPFLFGLLGMFFHFKRKPDDFLALLVLFVITGIGIIIYSNQPPTEPRERDYVLVGSFMTYCIWIGMAVLFLFSFLRDKISGIGGAVLAGALVLVAPILMGTQNYDDHDRSHHSAARDYAANFLNSVEPNAVIFTYGDNDTYPVWYAQEVENIRRDVRVVNLSLLQVDWYINKLRNKVNDSEPLKFTIPESGYTGKSLNQIFFPDNVRPGAIDLDQALQLAARQAASSGGRAQWPNKQFAMSVDQNKVRSSGIFNVDSLTMTDQIVFNFSGKDYVTKDEIAMLDIISSNFYERPIYYAVTCKNEKLMKANDFMQMEGLGLRLVPLRNNSDRTFQIYGSGRVAKDEVYDNVMNKFAWGNFDTYDTYVDKSYLAEVQAMKLTMLRGAMEFLRDGDKQKAADLANKYFESFPNMNFRYDAGVMPFINVLSQAEAYDDAKKHMRILAEETRQNAEFLISLDNDDLFSFNDLIGNSLQAIRDVTRSAESMNDPAFVEEMKSMLEGYNAPLSNIYSQVNSQN